MKSRLGFVVLAIALAGCAKIWGFEDLSGGGGANGWTGLSGAAGQSCTGTSYDCATDACGQLKNRCGAIVDCGDCSATDETCGGTGTPNRCGAGTCVPSCENKNCGDSDGCAGICSQGICPTGQHCALGACVDDATCSIGAPCPAVDCASCDLYCTAVGGDSRCYAPSTCDVSAECPPGELCSSSGYCRTPELGDRCSFDVECARPATTTTSIEVSLCQKNRCCAAAGSVCSVTGGCCAGLTCQSRKCCAELKVACAKTEDCCTSGAACQDGFCCIAPGTSGCRSNADCCAPSPGCVDGKCQ